MATSFPCIICGKNLGAYGEPDELSPQPYDGVMCRTSGNYGSRVFDPNDGAVLDFNICDTCLVEAGEKGRIFYALPKLTIQPRISYTPWHKGLEDELLREGE